MKLTTKSEYACLALIHLSKRYAEGFTRIEDIAKNKKIPKKYLEQILGILKRGRYVCSKRGLGGGYRLSKPPRKISVAGVLRLMDGPIASVGSVSKYFYEATPIEQNKRLVSLLKDIRDYAAKKLEKATFADLAGGRTG